VFDVGDASFDTTAYLDGFRWECDGCRGAECGIVLPP
jgi:hypothetical protein